MEGGVSGIVNLALTRLDECVSSLMLRTIPLISTTLNIVQGNLPRVELTLIVAVAHGSHGVFWRRELGGELDAGDLRKDLVYVSHCGGIVQTKNKNGFS